MSEKILRGEVYCRLKTIEKQYRRLQKQTFPTIGPERLIQLTLRLIEIILQRFSIYSAEQSKHIAKLCCTFEEICGFLSESRVGNVPWSIIPALEEIFQRVYPHNEFAICPIWESNYRIINRNIVALYRTIAETGNLIFDAEDKSSLDEEMKKLFGTYDDGIYFIFYPRLERISAVHFALLGHEIGHIYAEKWADLGKFGTFIQENDLENAFQKLAQDEWKKSPGIGATDKAGLTLFESSFIQFRKSEKLKWCFLLLKEIISDIYGAFIFGDAALVAQYLFCLRSEMDFVSPDGHPSHRFRVRFVSEALDYIRKQTSFPASIQSGWEKMIAECIKEPVAEEETDIYLAYFTKALQGNKERLFQEIVSDLGVNLFTNHVKEDLIRAAISRIDNKTTPNGYCDHDGKELPIDYRCILYATTCCLGREIEEDMEEYEKRTKTINLLAIKGIELSTEHERFIKYDADKE
jgi:hypothetical protein